MPRDPIPLPKLPPALTPSKRAEMTPEAVSAYEAARKSIAKQRAELLKAAGHEPLKLIHSRDKLAELRAAKLNKEAEGMRAPDPVNVAYSDADRDARVCERNTLIRDALKASAEHVPTMRERRELERQFNYDAALLSARLDRKPPSAKVRRWLAELERKNSPAPGGAGDAPKTRPKE